MPVGHRVTLALQTPPRPAVLLTTRQALLLAIINPKRRMEGPVQTQTPQPPRTCGSPGRLCWSLDVRVAAFLLTLAAAVILLLLYKLLQLRHRLRLASARHALEYHGFFHTATYKLKHPTPCEDPPSKNGSVPDESSLPIQTVTAVTPVAIAPLPAPPVPPLVPLPPPPSLPPPPLHLSPSPASSRQVLALPFPLPVIHTTPPSPHLSWGACSDADVYSRIGAFRPSRLSSLSSQSKVILFEHSSF